MTTTAEERPSDAIEKEVLDWADDVYREAEHDLYESHETKLTSKLIDFISSRQWSAKARHGRSRPVINRMFRQFFDMVGLLTDLELDFKVKFHDKIDGYSEMEKMMNEMILDWAYDSDFEMELAMVVMWGLISTGPVKVQWNPSLNNGLGEVEFQELSPLNFMTIGTNRRVQDAEICIARQPVSIPWLKRRYGPKADDVTPDVDMSNIGGEILRPAKFTKAQWSNMNPQLRRLLGIKARDAQSRVPSVMLKQFWFHDDTIWEGKESRIVGPVDRDGEPLANWCYRVERGEKLFPRGRVTIIAGNKVLEDTCNPYWHARFPFSVYRAFRVPWQFAGLSSLEPLAMMQSVLNRIYGGVLDTVYSAIERPLLAPASAFPQQDWDTMDPNEPGRKIKYNNNSPKEPRYMEAAALPNYVEATTNRIEREQDASSGSAAISQALNKKQVPGGDALDMIFNSRSTNIRLMGRSLKSFLIESGYLVSATMMQFYTAKHRVEKYGPKGILPQDCVPFYGQALPKGIKPESFVRKMGFGIRRGTLLQIEKSEDMPIMFGLRKMGDLSRKNVFRFLDRNIDVEQNERELKEEAAEKIAMGAAAAATQPHRGKK